MTFDERVEAVAKKGFTERQPRFLTTVMLHTGVCVPRQYARFCGIIYGEKTRRFFAKLVRLRYASMFDCRHNRARIYHVTRPRETPNSRVRDLVDLVLILEHEAPATERVSAAVDATFRRRGTHSVPDVVPAPPSDWAKPFIALAAECGLEHTLTTAHKRVEVFRRILRFDSNT